MSKASAKPATGGDPVTRGGTRPRWTMLTTHGAVLVYLSVRPSDSMRSMAAVLQMTERTVASAIADLRNSGYIKVLKRGQTNTYIIELDMPGPRAVFASLTIGDFLRALKISLPEPPASPPRPPRADHRAAGKN